MPTVEEVFQEIRNELGEVWAEIHRLQPNRRTEYKGQKSGADFTTDELQHWGQYGVRADTQEVQFNINGAIYVFASQSSSGSYAPSPHNLDGVHHSGTLGNAQAPQFLLLDGTRAMTGALDMGTNNITNVGTVDGINVSAHDHGANGGATVQHDQLGGVTEGQHHAAFVGLEGDAAGGVVPAADNRIRIRGDGSVSVTEATNELVISVDVTAIDHGGLSGLGDDDHPHYAAHAQNETITGLWTFGREVRLAEIATPTAPPAGYANLYAFDQGGVTEIRAMDAAGRDWSVNQDMFQVVRNVTGATLTKGTPVYISGETGTYSEVAPARADSLATMPVAGVLAEDIAANGYGAMMIGGVLDGLDTSAFATGDDLWVSATTAGALTATKPSHPNIRQKVAHVHSSGVGNGVLQIESHDMEGVEIGTRETAWVVGDETASDIYLIFDDGTNRFLMWDDDLARFFFNNPVEVAGAIYHDDPTTGHEIHITGNTLQVRSSSANTGGEPTLQFYSDDVLQALIGWDDELVNGFFLGVPATLGPQQIQLRANAELLGNLETDHWVSGLNGTGWAVTYAGAADFRSVFTEELRTYAFTAEIYSALAGALIITKSRARVSRDFTIPATSGTATLYVEDLEGFAETPVFTAGDYVELRVVDTSGGGLFMTSVFGTVSGYTDLTGGEQSWTFTTTEASYAGGDVIYAGSVALDYGQTGSGSRGVWEVTVLDSAGSPYSEVSTWSSITNGEPSGFTTWTRLGNLDGLSGIGQEYGLYAGQGTGTVDPHVIITDQQAALYSVNFLIYSGASVVYEVDPVVPYYAMGNPRPTAFGTGAGVWAGNDGGTYKWFVGQATGNWLGWNGSSLQIFTGGTSLAQWSGSQIRLGAPSDGPYTIFNTTSWTQYGSDGAAYASVSGTTLTLGRTADAHVTVTPTTMSFMDPNGVTLTEITAGQITLGNTSAEYFLLTGTEITAYASDGNAYFRVQDGDVRVGDWQTAPDINGNVPLWAQFTTNLMRVYAYTTELLRVEPDGDIRQQNSGSTAYLQTVVASGRVEATQGRFSDFVGILDGASNPAYGLDLVDYAAGYLARYRNIYGNTGHGIRMQIGNDTSGGTSNTSRFILFEDGGGYVAGYISGVPTNYYSSSDERNKDIIGDVDGAAALASLRGRRAVRYKIKGAGADTPETLGFLAQDWQDVPGVVDEHEGNLYMAYNQTIPYIYASQQALLDRIEELETRIAELEAA